jgi:cytochrome c oxidase subunit 3/cytochrome o ubiquinol oxidase subunit 3
MGNDVSSPFVQLCDRPRCAEPAAALGLETSGRSGLEVRMTALPANHFPSASASRATLSPAQWGMLAFLFSEVAFFTTLIAVYLCFLHRDRVGPTPAEALSLPLVICTTICLLSSSLVVHLAEGALERGRQRAFCFLGAGTIALGVAFVVGTIIEWRELIQVHSLTIGRNLFGTTYYTLVGFHLLHVTVGVIAMLVVLALAIGRRVNPANRSGVQLVTWYWHFVDAVWVAVFSVVYLFGR